MRDLRILTNWHVQKSMKSRYLKFKIGQFFWITLVSFLTYIGVFSVEVFKGPMVASCVICAALLPRYFYLSGINWGIWEKKDLERTIDFLRDLLICFLIYGTVFLPDWWFTQEMYLFFDEPVLFKLKNYAETDYHTAKELHKRYGFMIVILISTIDNWMISEQTRKIIDSKR